MKTIKIITLIGLLGVVAPAFAGEYPSWSEMTARSNEAINPRKLEVYKAEKDFRKQELLEDQQDTTKKIRPEDLQPFAELPWYEFTEQMRRDENGHALLSPKFNLDRAKEYAKAKSAYLTEKDKQIKATEWNNYGRIQPDKQRFSKMGNWNYLRHFLISQKEWDIQQKQAAHKKLMKEVDEKLAADQLDRVLLEAFRDFYNAHYRRWFEPRL